MKGRRAITRKLKFETVNLVTEHAMTKSPAARDFEDSRERAAQVAADGSGSTVRICDRFECACSAEATAPYWVADSNYIWTEEGWLC